MKKIVKILLALGLASGFISCSSSADGSSGPRIIEFGMWPQTHVDLSTEQINGLTPTGRSILNFDEYEDSNGNLYVKVTVDSEYDTRATGSDITFTTGIDCTGDETYYFKEEPIKWRVIDTAKGLIFAEKAICGVGTIPYYGGTKRTLGEKTIYTSNWKYSNIRAWLNSKNNQFFTDGGTKTSYEVDYTNKGFITFAFTREERNIIRTTQLDNSLASVLDNDELMVQSGSYKNPTDYICEDTEDKIFFLSNREITMYGFGKFDESAGPERIRGVSDFGKATYALKVPDNPGDPRGCWWCTRSPSFKGEDAWISGVASKGKNSTGGVGDPSLSFIPAMCIDLAYIK